MIFTVNKSLHDAQLRPEGNNSYPRGLGAQNTDLLCFSPIEILAQLTYGGTNQIFNHNLVPCVLNAWQHMALSGMSEG